MGAKERYRQEVSACFASQLQTSVIPQLNMCVCGYVCLFNEEEICYGEFNLASLCKKKPVTVLCQVKSLVL